MLTITDAAALLERVTIRSGRLALLRALGFAAPAGELDAAARGRLGLDGDIRRAEPAVGTGTLRAMLVEVVTDASWRDTVARTARRIAARSPELLWLIVAYRRSGDVALAVPSAGGGSAVAALFLEPSQLRPSDAESLAALHAACSASDLDTHLRWREALGRDALTRRFYRDLEQSVDALATSAVGNADTATRRTLALRCTSRLLFLSFLEAKGWLDGDRAFLSRRVVSYGARLHRGLLEPLFFGTLNTPVARRAAAARAFGRVPFLNGGLFMRDALEKRHRALRFTDDAIARIVGDLLGRYRVTAHEGSADFAEAAVDPEMLGRAFESLMASDERRGTGAFYTPPEIIRHITDGALDAAVPPAFAAALAEARAARVERALDAVRLREVLSDLRIVDPACGTGAFLVHAMTELSRLLRAAHDDRAEHVRRRAVLARSIFGVDINPTAVWLCELRLWLAVVVDHPERDPLAVPPLPNLDRNIRCADALAGPAFDVTAGDAPQVLQLRSRYARATGPRKQALQHLLDRAERALAIGAATARLQSADAKRRDLLGAVRGRDLFGGRRVASATERAALDRWRADARTHRRALAALRAGGAVPFGFASHFGDVAQRGGFDMVVGNPPWVRLHRIPPADRERLRAQYESMRNAAWRAGAAASGAMTGFAMQADLAALFTERAASLVRPGGVVALLVPSKLLRCLAGGGVRSLLGRTTTMLACEDFSGGRALFDAAVYPALVMARRHRERANADADEIICAVRHRDAEVRWRTPPTRLPYDSSEGAPWLLLPPAVRTAFDALAHDGTPLTESRFGRPLLGVKTGCNDAFVVSPEAGWRDRHSPAACAIRGDERESEVERTLLRPALRGEDLTPFRATASSAVIWTHDASGAPVRTLPPRAARWLSHWRHTLARRSDARSRDQWWSLFRLDAAAPAWRVVWGDVGRTPRAVVLTPDDPTVPLNSCYAVRAPSEDDADALAAWLNAPLSVAWLGAIAEPARGGYHRFLGWTMARLPLPRDWSLALRHLAPLGRAARCGTLPGAAELHDASLRAFRASPDVTEPLLTWMRW